MKKTILTLILSASVSGVLIAEETVKTPSSENDSSIFFGNTNSSEPIPISGNPHHSPLPAGTKGSIESPFTIKESKIESLNDIEEFVKKKILKKQPKSLYESSTYIYKDNKILACGYFLSNEKVGKLYFDITSCFEKLKKKDDKYNKIITTIEKAMDMCRNPKITIIESDKTDN